MKLYFEKLLAVIFPLSDDELRISKCDASTFTLKLNVHMQGVIEGLAPFKDPQMRSALHLVKFHNHRKAALLLSELLKARLQSLPLAEYALIPIPLSSERLRERGHNQVATIASLALKGFPNIQLSTNILFKKRNTKPQTTLNKKERESNLADVFAIQPKNIQKLRGKHIILLDDVTTTGTTLREALAVIQKGEPISVHCIALAY